MLFSDQDWLTIINLLVIVVCIILFPPGGGTPRRVPTPLMAKSAEPAYRVITRMLLA